MRKRKYILDTVYTLMILNQQEMIERFIQYNQI